MIAEPHKIKTIKELTILSFNERKDILLKSGLNTFNIHSDQVTFDMISHGLSARSQDQESGILTGDESYAGSRNFENLCGAIKEVFDKKFVCPTHNLQGALKLITSTMVKESNIVLSNSGFPCQMVMNRGGEFKKISNRASDIYTGNTDLEVLEEDLIRGRVVSYVYIDLYESGYNPVFLNHLKEIRRITEFYNCILCLNVSNIVELASFIKFHNTDYAKTDIQDIVIQISEMADVIVLNAAEGPRCNTGGLIATNNSKLYEKYMNEVVIYEGLHTYGGMAGRTMESFARGVKEMVFEPQAEWINKQVNFLSDQLKPIPHFRGADGLYLKANEILPQINKDCAQALAALLYLKSGIRCIALGKYKGQAVLPVQVPRLAYTNDQLRCVANAIKDVFAESRKLKSFKLINSPEWEDEAHFEWNDPDIVPFYFDCEAHRILTFEYVGITNREERQRVVEEVGYNTFLLPSKAVTIDFLTDSGTSAQTIRQWSVYYEGDDTPASSKDYFSMVEALKEITGYRYIIPTHQGRAAEHIMSQILIKDGFVPGNMYFTTTKLHQEMAGGTFVDVICEEAHDPTSTFEWKGNIDISKIQKIIDKHGEGSIPYISFELSVNLAGGQPVHMQNVREVYEFCKVQHIPVMLDATRAVENAYMIKKKDPEYEGASIKEILRELFTYSDGCTVSSKKDYLVNIGGFLGIRDNDEFYRKALAMLRIYEGTRTNGGMSGGDMAMHAVGVKEMVDINHIQWRVEQTQYLGQKLLYAGIPVVEPIGTHAVFLDAKRFLSHIEQDHYPAQTLAAELFVESGIRAMERGNVSSGRDKKTGKNYRPALELVRLTIPRRTYTNAHMDLIAESIIALYKRRKEIRGLEFTYEPENLRFFQGRFRRVESKYRLLN